MTKLSKGSITKIVFCVLALAILLLPASSANAEAKQKPQAGAAAKTKINAKQAKKNQEFCDAVKNYYYGRVEEFLKAGQDPNTCPKEDCKNYSTYMIKQYLLPYGFNPNACDIDIVSKFNLKKEADFAKELVLKHGAKPSLVNVYDLATAEFMYEKGAEITDMAIEAAIQNNNTEAFKFFMSKDDKIIEKAWKIIDDRNFVDKEDFVYSFEPDLEKIISNTDDKQLKEFLYEVIKRKIRKEQRGIEIRKQEEIEKRIEMKIQEYPQEEQEEIRAKEYQKIDAKNKELCDAVRNNDLEKVKQALANDASANTGCRTSDYDCFKYSLDSRFSTGVFKLAVEKGNYEVMKVLLQHGADTNIPDIESCESDEKYFPIYTAISNNNIELIELLIDNGARFKSSLSESWISPSKETIKYLIERGAYLPDIIPAQVINDKPFVEYLIKHGVKPTLFHLDNVEDLQFMLNMGADINEQSVIGNDGGVGKDILGTP
ncbi:MAG: ankyrin repeat domain-containing protein, partial [Elusimicrobiota bacterium]|nr:ankyrin repeat domain-containing protein [Elusimicrobiota bacterium]